MNGYNKLMKKAQAVVKSAGEILIARSSTEKNAKDKGVFDFVTNIDTEVETFVKAELVKVGLDYEFISEEHYDNPLLDKVTYWVLDPIDGTTNYINNLNSSAVALCLVEDGVEQLGIVYNPFNKELFTAIRGEGAYLNNKRIQVSTDESIKRNLCFFGVPCDRTKLKDVFNYVHTISSLFGDCKRLGPASIDICGVACGRATCYIELNLKKWDILAGKLILEEAGGLLVDINGDTVDITKDSFSIIACTKDVQKRILKLYKDEKTDPSMCLFRNKLNSEEIQ